VVLGVPGRPAVVDVSVRFLGHVLIVTPVGPTRPSAG
jgi:hypothetical protein